LEGSFQMTFDRVLETLLRTCEQLAEFNQVERACVIRGPDGRVRLVIAPYRSQTEKESTELLQKLENELAAALSKFYPGRRDPRTDPIEGVISTADKPPRGNVARSLLEKGQPWINAEYNDSVTGKPVSPIAGRWMLLERRLSKLGWLDTHEVRDIWPLSLNLPSIVTFYSFKGGVGRTTALVSCALQLAERGERVAILDLDLEAPGLGPLLDVETERGVVDMIVDHIATDTVDLDQSHGAPRTLDPSIANHIDVFPAGRLDHGFLEKLARLDFTSAAPWGNEQEIPVRKAMVALLSQIRKELKPKWILLDARAGLHDLAGLSLHGLAHADVLVTRASEQAYQGLELTIRALSKRKSQDRLRCITVHGFAPQDPNSSEGQAEIIEMHDRAYDIFCEHVYPASSANIPAIDDQTAAHWPWPLKRNSNLERFTSISSVQDDLRTQQHKDLLQRIEELCAPDASGDST
jgi:MinD-like ATPase involved in chromosome partitioning or flagellar assembly